MHLKCSPQKLNLNYLHYQLTSRYWQGPFIALVIVVAITFPEYIREFSRRSVEGIMVPDYIRSAIDS